MQVAEDKQDKYPLASLVTRRDFYVDDILSGADTEAEALALQRELIHRRLPDTGGFTLKRWISNCDKILEGLSPDWNATLPTELAIEWEQYRRLICKLGDIEINRWTGYHSTRQNVQLYAFCDASIKSYAAAPVKAVSLARLVVLASHGSLLYAFV